MRTFLNQHRPPRHPSGVCTKASMHRGVGSPRAGLARARSKSFARRTLPPPVDALPSHALDGVQIREGSELGHPPWHGCPPSAPRFQ